MANEEHASVELRAAVLTDVGMVRDHNEDSAHVDPQHHFFIVADGMGGHAAGEVASAMAVGKVRESLENARSEIEAFAASPDEERRTRLVHLLEAAVRTAHQSVFERGSNESDKQGMGTTLDVVLVAGPEAFVAHVGDSRTYLIRDGRAAQITTDHTVAEVLVIEGKLSVEEAQVSPLRTILVNAIGVAPDVGIEMAHVQLRQGDQLLVCSDGLHDYFPVEQELADHIVRSEPDDALNELISLAKERGGHDNITGVVVRVVKCDADFMDDDDGRVLAPMENVISDGVPASIERDDTLPVDLEELDAFTLDEAPTREKLLGNKKKRGASPIAGQSAEARSGGAALSSLEFEETQEQEDASREIAAAAGQRSKVAAAGGEYDEASMPTQPMPAVPPPDGNNGDNASDSQPPDSGADRARDSSKTRA